jgi:hypothetical protein
MIVVQRIGEEDAGRIQQDMIGPNDHDETIPPIGVPHQAACCNIRRTDADFSDPLLDTADYLGTRARLQIKPNQFMSAKEDRQIVRSKFDDRDKMASIRT